MTRRHWWDDAVIYQIYVSSFFDSDGNGLGDIRGILARLDYLEALAIDALWLSPIYVSPRVDGGYDVSDHRAIDPQFGTLADLDELISAAHAMNIKVLLDVVPNHTSAEHPWFREALGAAPGSRARDRYFFRDGLGVDGSEPPNNWTSTFGGPAWTRVEDGQWYLHTFHRAQPELNWESSVVRADFLQTLRFWLGRGVDGVRIDVAHGMAKPSGLPDLPAPLQDMLLAGEPDPRRDVDAVHDIHREIRAVLDEFPDAFSVGEVWIKSADRQRLYVRDAELHSIFDFRLLLAPWEKEAISSAITQTFDVVAQTSAPASWVLSNHDETRVVTRYGDGAVGERRARAAALLQLALPGVHYIYMGDELALPSVEPPADRRVDVAARSRDSSRLPLPWAGETPPYSFNATGAMWLPSPLGWASLSVSAQEQSAESVLSLYRRAIRSRQAFAGELHWVRWTHDTLVFERGDALCIVNFGDVDAPLPDGELILSSIALRTPRSLPPDAAAWLTVGRESQNLKVIPAAM